MVRIPFLKRQPKPDAPQVKDDGRQQAKKKDIPLARSEPAAPPAAPRPRRASSLPAVPEISPAAAEADTAAPAAPAASPEAPAASPEALAILQAMPDYIFRIGPDGTSPALGNGHRPHGQAAGDPGGDSKPLGEAIREELSRRPEEYRKKALEAGRLQAFQVRVKGDREPRDIEVRVVPLNQSEVLAVAQDVTERVQKNNALIESRNEMENHLKERNAELVRVNKMLKGEAELRGEQEEVLKKNFHRLERLLEDTIGAITMIVQERDPHVADHQRRVSLLAFAVAQDMSLRNDRLRAVRMAAQLHDLGKIFIPAEILRKPGKLTPAELSVVMTHPDTDYRILKRIDFPISIADVVRQHHERMDGSGYPLGLKGQEILLEARIVAVADVIEGMVFERPYRVAPGLEAALKEISDNRGTLYDAAVADACLKLFAEERFRFEPVVPGVNAGEVTLDPDQRDR